MKTDQLSSLISDFTVRLTAFVEESVAERMQAVLAGAFAPAKRGPGRLPAAASSHLLGPGLGHRKKPPKQLCPVPGCTKPAAPVFGMVCADHRDVPKAKIRKYRAERKAAKKRSGGKGA